MGKRIEASDLPEDSKIYFRKDMFGYRIIHPNRNPDGSINWINLLFGGWNNLLIILIILLIIGVMFLGFSHQINLVEKHYENISADPYKYCETLLEQRPLNITTMIYDYDS